MCQTQMDCMFRIHLEMTNAFLPHEGTLVADSNACSCCRELISVIPNPLALSAGFNIHNWLGLLAYSATNRSNSEGIKNVSGTKSDAHQ